MTLAEKILAAHCGKDRVSPGEFVNVSVDLVFANDTTAPLSINGFEYLGVEGVFDPGKVVMLPDHFAPSRDIQSAEQTKLMREFAQKQGISYFELGRLGIEHVLLPEQGYVWPGLLIVGADSHTCTYGALGAFATGVGSTDTAVAMATGQVWMRVPATIRFAYHGELSEWITGKDLILLTIGDVGVDGALYKVMEFYGDAIDQLPMDGRFTMANMAIEAGAKTGIFGIDEKTKNYLKERPQVPSFQVTEADPDARYEKVVEYDVSRLEPQVAFPYLPSNVRPISQVGEVRIDQVVIGGCTNGRLTDLRLAARILGGRQVNDHVRCIVLPGSQRVYLDALNEGLIRLFIESGAAVSTPSCGPCFGGHLGILASGERCVSTTNRNFVGRMGSPLSEVYLANPAVAAASAVAGKIMDPREVLS